MKVRSCSRSVSRTRIVWQMRCWERLEKLAVETIPVNVLPLRKESYENPLFDPLDMLRTALTLRVRTKRSLRFRLFCDGVVAVA